jgi:hypothetical protein
VISVILVVTFLWFHNELYMFSENRL